MARSWNLCVAAAVLILGAYVADAGVVISVSNNEGVIVSDKHHADNLG